MFCAKQKSSQYQVVAQASFPNILSKERIGTKRIKLKYFQNTRDGRDSRYTGKRNPKVNVI